MAPELVSRLGSRIHNCEQPVLNVGDLERSKLYNLPEFIPDGSNQGHTVCVRDPVNDHRVTNARYGVLSDAATLVRKVDSFPYWCERFPHIFRSALREHGATQAHGAIYQYLRHIGMLNIHQVSTENQPATCEPGQPVAAEGSQVVPTEIK